MIFDKVEAFDRVHMAGPHYSEDCKSLWRTLVDNNYICDERYRPGENLFLVKNKGWKPPSEDLSVNCSYPEFTPNSQFANQSTAEQICYMSGGRPARSTDLIMGVNDGFTEGCACAYVSQDDKLWAAMAHSDPSCSSIPDVTRPVGVFSCTSKNTDYIWCYRGSPSSNKYFGLQYAPWCATYSLLSPTKVGLEERNCYSANYFVCKKKIKNTCGPPVLPANSHFTREDWSIGGDGANISCNPGYGLSADPLSRNITLTCSNATGVNVWEPDSLLLQCLRLSCPDPPFKPHGSVVTSPAGILSGDYKFSDKVTITCDYGYAFGGKPGAKVQDIKCGTEQLWEPDATKFNCLKIKCEKPIHLANSKLTYNESTEHVLYHCDPGYWISRGVHNITGFMCNESGLWDPDPVSIVFCIPLTCGEPDPSPRANIFVTSHRWLANLTINCELGLSVVPHDLRIVCNQYGDWVPSSKHAWCKNVTCPTPQVKYKYTTASTPLLDVYLYDQIQQYHCNKTGYVIRKRFQIHNPHQTACLSADDSTSVSM
uniref:sushi, von Willebrand factor type A, EGF and pentraxin domain-containing protein 1-like n=1 Tax=Ciona intestinalis TaxID=7719 RepID=UPI000EF4A1F1